jgi:competence protein ComEC
MLGEELAEDFRRAGITHILAVSGLHVGILSVIIMSMLSFLKGRRVIISVIISLSAIWIFAFVTGLSPSVTRASLMFSFLHIGRLSRRPVNNINSLLASAFMVMVINPPVLFEAGFQLSYSAVLFILLFFKPLYSSIAFRNTILDKLWSMTVVTCLAQLGTLPFVLYYFQSIPVMSFITNIIAIPSAFVILSGGLALLITSPLPLIPLAIAAATGKTAMVLINIADRVASLPFSTIETGTISLPLFISIIILVPLCTSFIARRGSIHPHILLSSAIITIIASAY